MTGWISGSASTEARDIGGCAAAYPPFFSLQPWVVGVIPRWIIYNKRKLGSGLEK